MCVTLWSALLLWPQDCMHSPVLLGKNTSSPVSPSAGTGFYLGYLSSVQCASCSVCPRHPSRSSGWDAAARGDHSTAAAATPAAPTCSSTASASQTAPSSLLEVSQPFTVQHNRKIQKPFPVLHHSQALFLSKSFSLLRQHCSCCTRSLTLSPLSLHLPSILLLLFFPFLFGGAAEMKHSPPRLFLQALNCPNRSMWFSPCTSFAHC